MTVPAHRWLWRAKPVRAVDGDTIDVILDAGFHSTRMERLRLLGINTPEVVGANREAGLRAKLWVEQWLEMTGASTWSLIVETQKTDSFGRYLGMVWSAWSGECLNTALLELGLAKPYGVD